MQIYYEDCQHQWKVNWQLTIWYTSLQIDTLLLTLTEILTEILNDKTLVNVLSHLQNGKWSDNWP